MSVVTENAKINSWEHNIINRYACVIDIKRQKSPGNLVISILEYTGISRNLILLLLYEPCDYEVIIKLL